MAGIVNRNQRKKVYQVGRSQTARPFQVQFDNNIEYFDRTLVIYDQSPFTVLSPFSYYPATIIYGEYDEDTVEFSTFTSVGTKAFNRVFTSTPTVVLSVVDANTGFENVNVFLGAVTSTSIEVHTSAPFSGQITYRAIYASSYPIFVSRSVASTSYFYTASAGYVDVVNNSSVNVDYSMIATGSLPTMLFFTTQDISGSGDANVGVAETGSYGLSGSTVELTAPITNRLHYLAVR